MTRLPSEHGGDWDSDPECWRDHKPGQVGDDRQVPAEQTTEAALCNQWRWERAGRHWVREIIKIKTLSWNICPLRCLQPLHSRVLFRPVPQDIREHSGPVQEGRTSPDGECLSQGLPRGAGVLGAQCSTPGSVKTGGGGGGTLLKYFQSPAVPSK